MSVTYQPVEELTEQLDSTPATTRRGKWMRVGVASALAVAGCMGLGLKMANSRKPSSPLNNWSSNWAVTQKAIVKAFTSRRLLDDVSFESKWNWLFKEDGADDPSAMSIAATFKKSDEKAENLAVKVSINAVEGKGEELTAQLNEIWSALLARMQDPGDDDSEGPKPDVTITADGDTSVVVFVPPPQPDLEEDIQENIEPKHTELTATIKFGRTLEDMWNARSDKLPLLFGGVKVVSNLQMASAFFSTMKDLDMVQKDPVVMGDLDFLSQLKTNTINEEMIYKQGATFDESPALDQVIEWLTATVTDGLGDDMDKFKGLNGLANGLKSVELIGLPQQEEIVLDFTEFKVTPIIASIIDASETPGEEDVATGEEDAE